MRQSGGEREEREIVRESMTVPESETMISALRIQVNVDDADVLPRRSSWRRICCQVAGIQLSLFQACASNSHEAGHETKERGLHQIFIAAFALCIGWHHLLPSRKPWISIQCTIGKVKVELNAIRALRMELRQ